MAITKLFNRAVSSAQNFGRSVANGFREADTKPRGVLSDQESLVYPLDLRDNPDRPVIVFKAIEKKDNSGHLNMHRIYFPCPPSIQFSDGANYNSLDLGALGGSTAAASAAAYATGSVSGGVGTFAGALAQQSKSIKAGEAASLVAQRFALGDELRSTAGLITQNVANPNTNTFFQGNTVRTFSFNFKMIARNAQESEQINAIHQKFRKFTYADASAGNNLTLSYPPVWNIDFMNLGVGLDNRFIPKIYACYLTSVNSTLNSTSGMFHKDGAPIEVDVSVTYQETRALNRTDIVELEETQNTNAARGVTAAGGASLRGQPAATFNPGE